MPRRRAAVLLVVTTLIVLGGGFGLVGLTRGGAQAANPNSLRALSESAGCNVLEIYQARRTNPATSGAFKERDRVPDGDYTGARTPPPLRAVMHALEHGRVLIQYRGDATPQTLGLLRRFYGEDRRKTLLFENQTGMRYEVAAVAYLSAIVCPRFTARAVPALRAFRERRREFGQRL